jgi:hypothetical protein
MACPETLSRCPYGHLVSVAGPGGRWKHSLVLVIVGLICATTLLPCDAATLAANFSVVLQSPGTWTGPSNFSYSVYASFGTTGRVAIVGNPKSYFRVHCAGCEAAQKCPGVLETVEVQAKINNCRYATNGGPFGMINGDCITPIIVNGSIMNNASQGSFQCVGMFRNGSWILGFIDPDLYSNILNMMCGFEFLVVDGQALSFSAQEVAPRTVFGFTDDGALITLVAEGSEVAYTGLTLNQTSQWIQQLGARYAINMDGGGSSTSYWADNGGVQGCPTCIDEPYCCSRSVTTIMCVPYDS